MLYYVVSLCAFTHAGEGHCTSRFLSEDLDMTDTRGHPVGNTGNGEKNATTKVGGTPMPARAGITN